MRHEPQAIGIDLDKNGWANIDALIQGAEKHGRRLDRKSLDEVVKTNEKKRFSISEDGLSIRAVQGHSTSRVDVHYVEKNPPEFLYHGTATRFIDSIKEKGLIPGQRHYVHLSADTQTAIQVGARYGKPVVLKIAALKMQKQGFRFFQAENGVWLTDHIPYYFIKQS